MPSSSHTRVEFLSGNERNTFEGTITMSYDGKDRVKGEVFVGDGDYFYKLELIAWRYCNDKIKELYNIGIILESNNETKFINKYIHLYIALKEFIRKDDG